jgi:hypothetical protein
MCENLDTDLNCRQCESSLMATTHEATENLPSPQLMSATTTWGESALGPHGALVLKVHNSEDQIFLPSSQHVVIGRIAAPYGKAAFIDLTPFGLRAMGVSRRHAMLEISDHVLIIDLMSANGTFLNGHRLSSNRYTIVRNGDELRFGAFVTDLYFIAPHKAQSA